MIGIDGCWNGFYFECLLFDTHGTNDMNWIECMNHLVVLQIMTFVFGRHSLQVFEFWDLKILVLCIMKGVS